MHKKPHRVNARFSAQEYERARELLSSRKLYGVHSLSDVLSIAVWQLYDTHFPKVLGQIVPVLGNQQPAQGGIPMGPEVQGERMEVVDPVKHDDNSAAKSMTRKCRKGRVKPRKPKPRKPLPKPHGKRKVEVAND